MALAPLKVVDEADLDEDPDEVGELAGRRRICSAGPGASACEGGRREEEEGRIEYCVVGAFL